MHGDVKRKTAFFIKVRTSMKFSWQVVGISRLFFQDNDDDGETAAGGRLAHLLQILVSSCVT